MKRIVAIFTFACSLFGVMAQNSPDTRPMWGVKAAFDLNLPGKWHGDAGSVNMYRYGFGGTLGAVCNVWLGHNFYLEPGVSIFYDTYSYKGVVFSADGSGYGDESDPSLYKVGVRVPVVAGYSFAVGSSLVMSVFTGPEMSYAFAGKVKLKNPELAGQENGLDLFGRYGTQRHVDCAWKFGFGWQMYDSWMISLEGAVGMTDLLRGGMTFRENRLSVALTRYF